MRKANRTMPDSLRPPTFIARAVNWLRDFRNPDRALARVCVAAIVVGMLLRVHDFSFPDKFSFDEHHFVLNAQNFLAHRADWNDHPPLGKIILALGIEWLGDNSVGWRIMPILFGLSSIWLVYQLGVSVFRSRSAGLIAAAFVALDGFFISYSRTALLDGMLAALVLAGCLVAVDARKPWHVAMAALLTGIAASVKWSGIVVAMPLTIAVLLLGRAPRWSIVYLGLVPLVYYVQYAFGLANSDAPWGPATVYRETMRLLGLQLNATTFEHPLCVKWYWWLIMIDPIVLRYDQVGERLRIMNSMGNPLVWWSATAALGVTLVGLAGAGLRWATGASRAATSRFFGYFGERWQELLLLFSMWLAPVLPWILFGRDSYYYHYLPAYGFALCLLAGLVAHLYETRRWLAGILLSIYFTVGIAYAPFAAQLPVKEAYWRSMMLINKWR